jgi:hypothetical protein
VRCGQLSEGRLSTSSEKWATSEHETR